MSPSSTGDSPMSVGASSSSGRPFPLPSRDTFSIDISSPQLNAINGSSVKSPTGLKPLRNPSFSREGILGSAQKARNLSQASDQQGSGIIGTNGLQKSPSDEGSINPLKRRNTDATVDYPRRRATIAVGFSQRLPRFWCLADLSIVRSMSLPKVAVRRHKTKMQALYRTRCRVYLSRARDQA